MPGRVFPTPRNYRAVLRRVVDLTASTKHFEWEVIEGGRFDFLAGQFISLTLDRDGQQHTRAYSIASAPGDDARFDLCLNRVEGGLVSNYLCDLCPGTVIAFTGPHGFFTVERPLERDQVFIATGTGIAPIRGMLADIFSGEPDARHSVSLLFGVRYPETILYQEEFARWAATHSNFHFLSTLSRPPAGWPGATGHVQAQLRQLLAGRTDFTAYICGLKVMVDDVRRILRDEFGLARRQIRYEKYD